MKDIQYRAITHQMLERLTYIHNRIKAECYPNASALAEKLECSVPTINRDIAFLRDRFHAPIEYNAQKKGFYYSAKYEIPLQDISKKDVTALVAAKTLLQQYQGTPIYKELVDAIDFITFPQRHGTGAFINRIAVPPKPYTIIDEAVFTALYQAMIQNRTIEFDYRGVLDSGKVHRRVRPYQLLFDDGRYFLFGYAEERQAERLFYIPRIEHLCITDELFTLPENYDFISRCGGGRFGSFMEPETVTYRIAFYGESRLAIKDSVWADDQKITEYDEEGKTEIVFSAAQGYRILKWVLSHGSNAQPLEPEEFVQDWQAEIQAMARRSYNMKDAIKMMENNMSAEINKTCSYNS